MAKKILIIDDIAAMAEVVKAHVESETPYKVIISTSAREGIERVQTEKPDLVLLDIKMPEMDGLEVLANIKTIAPELPVAMLSAIRDEREAQQAMQAGAYDYITKPVDFEYLKTVLFAKLFT